MIEYNAGVPTIIDNSSDERIWWIDVGPFKDRLGMDALAIACSNHDACKATKEMLYDRKYIDLKDPRISMMLDILISTQQPAVNPMFPGSGPMTTTKKEAVLNTITLEKERTVKNLG